MTRAANYALQTSPFIAGPAFFAPAQKVVLSNGRNMEKPAFTRGNVEYTRRHSIVASTSPGLTAMPAEVEIFFTRPFFGDLISFCIFMASTTRIP